MQADKWCGGKSGRTEVYFCTLEKFNIFQAAQTGGVLISGPGGIRASSLQALLVPLLPEQLELVNKAKKYAMEQSIKSIVTKQSTAGTTTTTTSQTLANNPQQQQKTIQRHQALVLMCRVYVGSLSFELREETVKAAFATFGAVKCINMSWDPVTLKHKGFAFVEYELPEAAELALKHMNGLQLGGRQIKVGRPSNMPQAEPVIQQIQEECKKKNRIYLSNVHPDLFEQELANLLEPFGKVLYCKLAMTPNAETPSHRGYAFIEFETEEAALEALTMDNFDLGGQVLHVCRATTPAENVTIHGTLETETIVSTSTTAQPQINPEEDIQFELERANQEQEAAVSNQNGTYQDNHHQTEDKKSKSNILVLRNMVTAEEELDDTLQLDVYEECRKHGDITQVLLFVDKAKINQTTELGQEQELDKVKIFIKYKDNLGSRTALEALDGRFFGGRKVSAQLYDKESFRLSDYSR